MKIAPIAFRIDPDLKADLQRLADADDRSLSNYIERVLRQHLQTVEAAAVAPSAPGRAAQRRDGR